MIHIKTINSDLFNIKMEANINNLIVRNSAWKTWRDIGACTSRRRQDQVLDRIPVFIRAPRRALSHRLAGNLTHVANHQSSKQDTWSLTTIKEKRLKRG